MRKSNTKSHISLVLLLAIGMSKPLSAQVQSEDEMFGEPKADSVKAPDPGLASLTDTLQIGGRLEIRSNSQKLEDQRFQEGPYSQTKTADIYFDSRPNKDVRVFFRTRFYEAQAASPEDPVNTEADTPTATENRGVDTISQSIDELWFKWDIDDTVFITAGKQHLKWGRGRVWNPTDFTALDIRDPFALFDRRLGQELIKIHVPFEKQGHNLYAVLQFDGNQRNDDVGLALRSEFAFGSSGEAAFSLQSRRGHAQRVGFDLGTGLGPIDLNIETALSRRESRTFFKGDFDIDTLTFPEAYKDEDRWYSQSVLGLQYSFNYSDEDSATIGVEGFWNEMGYEDRKLEFISLISAQSQVLYSGRQYVAGYLSLMTPGSWNDSSFYLTGVQNISDKTALARLTATHTLYKQISIEAYVSRCFGEYGELCFKVPPEIFNSPNYASFPEPLKTVVNALPRKSTQLITGLGLSMLF